MPGRGLELGDISEALRQARLESDETSVARRGPDPAEALARALARGVRALRKQPVGGLARIPATRDAGWQTRAVWVQKHGPVAESFRHLALQVRKELAARHASSVLVVSCGRGEGKTLTACNLALALASLSAGERIALVELDLRMPGMARSLGVPCEVGFESVLTGERALEECRVPTELSALDLYPVRRSVRQPHEWLTRPSVAATLLQLERSYAVVVCDGPPALPVPDVEIIAPHVGACLPVVRAGRTPRAGYRELVGILTREKVIGTFLNCARPPRHTRALYRQDDHQPPDEEPVEKA